MPLNEKHPDAVVFVCAEDENGNRTPIGTAFLVGMPRDDGEWCLYFITAAHIVLSGGPNWIRFRRRDILDVADVPISGWVVHPTSDIAATLCDVDLSSFVYGFIEDWVFADRWHQRAKAPLRIGEEAYFVGLLAEVQSMADRNIPMVRSGRIGAFYQKSIPMRDRKTRRTEPVAHLLDSYSRSGFSGSPCFADHPVVEGQIVKGNEKETMMGLSITSLVALVGVVIGHFDSEGENAGVAIVAPVEAVRELLETEDLVERCKRASKGTRARISERVAGDATPA